MIRINNDLNVTVKDFEKGIVTPFVFPITNTSNFELKVSLDKVSCSCTTLDPIEFILSSGESKMITGTVNRTTNATFNPNVRYCINSPEELTNMSAKQYTIVYEVKE